MFYHPHAAVLQWYALKSAHRLPSVIVCHHQMLLDFLPCSVDTDQGKV